MSLGWQTSFQKILLLCVKQQSNSINEIPVPYLPNNDTMNPCKCLQGKDKLQ